MPLLIVIAWAVVALAILASGRGIREAALVGYTAVAGAILLLTQVLSLVHGLSFWPTTAFWFVAILALVWALRAQVSDGWHRLRSSRRPAIDARIEWLVVAVLGTFALGTFFSAVLYPITNFDSLTYHMPRVLFWFQNHSAAPYPTSEARQIFSSPLVEYMVLQFKILALGGDRLSNLVQWLSYVFAIVSASLIAGRLGATRRGQQVAAIAAAAVPMAILQASTTQNDLTCALWSLGAVYWMLETMLESGRRSSFPWMTAAAAGVSLGLAFQTKPTAYLFVAPFLVWFALGLWRRAGLKRTLAIGAATAAVALALSAGWFVQNASLLGGADVLGVNAPGNVHIIVRDRTPSAVAANAVKNASMMLGTPSVGVNEQVSSALRSALLALGWDPENPLTKESDDFPYRIDEHVASHDVAPGPAIVCLLLFSLVALFLVRGAGFGTTVRYVVCAGAGLFLTAGLIKYNYYTNRVLLGSVLLWIPIVGLAHSALEKPARRFARTVLLVLLVVAVLWGGAVMVFNSTNRLVPPSLLPLQIGNRDLGYWNTSIADLQFRLLTPQLEQPMKRIAAEVAKSGAEKIGLDVEVGNFTIYPLLSLLRDRTFGYVRTIVLPDKTSSDFTPDAVVAVVEKTKYDASPQEYLDRGDQLMPPQVAGEYVLLLYTPN